MVSSHVVSIKREMKDKVEHFALKMEHFNHVLEPSRDKQ